MAHYYASQCKDIENKEAKRHTFWVNATTITSMKESYQEILAAITPSELNHVLDDNTKCLEVKKWLEDDSNGFWMLVVDGFDSPKDAAQIESFLPKQGSGQILYTTRNRARVKHLVQLNRGAAIQVERPENSDCLRIFRRYLDPILAGNPQQTATLLEYLWCPQVIKETATRMNNEHMSVMELLVDLKDNSHLSLRANFVEHFRKDLLRPLLETVDDFSKLLKNPPRAIQILSHLAFFHEEGVDMEILKAGFKQDQYRDEYRPTLTILQDCCLVDHIETRDDESYIKKYILRNPIRSIILAWIEREEGALGLLKRYNVVLSTLYFYYEESKKSDIESEDGRKSKQPLSSHKSRLPLMPHFAQFVKFVTVRARRNLKVEFELDNVAIRAIANFSRALVDQGRHGEAERVLEFARRHYFSDTNRDDDTKARRKDIIWFRLGQQLVKTYLSRPKGQSPQPNLVKAEKLALALYTDAGAKAAGTNSLKWAGSKVLKWECLLDLVRVYWESDQIEKASKELQTMRMIKVCVDKGKATLPEHAELPDILARTDLNEGELARIQNLSLKVRYEEGLLFLAEGEKFTKQKELERARQSWSAARKAFEDVLIAIKEWFGDDHPWLNDVRVSLADAIIKGASPQNLHQAERALDAAHQNILVEFGRNSRKVWSIERKLNAARLSLGDAGHAAQVEISSRRLLQAFEQSDLRDREAVEHCAEHLRDALIRLGRRAEAQNLSERFSNLPQLAAVVPNNWKLRQRRAVLILVSLICISCFLFAMWTMIGTDSWHLSQD
jgi:hypothetical protein